MGRFLNYIITLSQLHWFCRVEWKHDLNDKLRTRWKDAIVNYLNLLSEHSMGDEGKPQDSRPPDYETGVKTTKHRCTIIGCKYVAFLHCKL
jgi:hypothetical protein